MTIPKTLYKYQPFDDHTKENLARSQFYFQTVNRLNDPFDCAIVPALDQISESDFEQSLEHARQHWTNKAAFDSKYTVNGKPNDLFKKETLEGANGSFEKYKLILLNERGITCFSEVNDDILMWAHYAKGHTGLCLEFDTSFHPFEKAMYVHYRDDFPSVNPISVQLLKEDVVTPMVTTKAKCWSYEKEWRILHKPGGNVTVNYAPECLTGIFFGTKMSDDQKFEIIRILKGSHVRNGFFEIHRHDTQFRLVCRRLPQL